MVNLTPSRIIAIGALVVFGLPACIGIAIGYFFGFWFGVAAAIIVLLMLVFLVQWYIKRKNMSKNEDSDGTEE